MSVPVFIAGASREAERCRRWIDKAKASPYLRITQDWLEHIERVGRACPEDEEQQQSAASANWRGIAEAQIFWLLAPSVVSRDSWGEVTLALSSQCFVYSSGASAYQSINCSLGERYPTDIEAWAAILTHARGLAK